MKGKCKMKYDFTPKGVCSRGIHVELDGDVIRSFLNVTEQFSILHAARKGNSSVIPCSNVTRTDGMTILFPGRISSKCGAPENASMSFICLSFGIFILGRLAIGAVCPSRLSSCLLFIVDLVIIFCSYNMLFALLFFLRIFVYITIVRRYYDTNYTICQ